MRTLLVLIALASTARADGGANQLRLELGVGGPGGAAAVRYSRVLPTRTRIEPAIGLAYTGVLGSLLVTQPFVRSEDSWRGHVSTTTIELYAGYSVSALGDGLRHPLAGREDFLPDGIYHWLDAGISLQGTLPWFQVTGGVGFSKLLAGPDGIGGPDLDEETFWFLYGEGWIGKQRWAPALWSSIGWQF
jgi:hypothetical protein